MFFSWLCIQITTWSFHLLNCLKHYKILCISLQILQWIMGNMSAMSACTSTYGIFSKKVTPPVAFFVLWSIRLFHLLKTCNRVHFLLVPGKLYTDLYSFLYLFCFVLFWFVCLFVCFFAWSRYYYHMKT